MSGRSKIDAPQALEELRICLMRRPGETCLVRKEFLAVAVDALERQAAIAAAVRRAALFLKFEEQGFEDALHAVEQALSLCEAAA
jgi:hypothetical protein